MEFFRRNLLLCEAIICSFALMFFAFFIQYGFPLKLISLVSLIIVAYFIGRNMKSGSDIRKITGVMPDLKSFLLFSSIGIIGGVAFAISYRWSINASLSPVSIQLFAVVAALIGSMEEVVFRGYLQDSVKSYGPLFSVSFSTISHTGYKCCLFLSPMAMMKVDIGFLALWTIIAGSIFGIIRHLTKSLIPSLVAHALFDIWVYAEFVNAPWWVW